MIQEFKVYEELFEEIDKKTSIKLDIYVIGGAALLYRGIKPATKDIDIVVRTEEEFEELKKLLYDFGFTDSKNRNGYERLNLAIKVKRDDIEIDLFLNKICSKFSFSHKMLKRSEKVSSYDKVTVLLGSNEDIFAFKTITQRPGDIDDCVALAKRGLEWEIILTEIKSQVESSGQDIWITWINDRLIDLEEKGVEIPILDETNRLSEKYYESNL
ncbi:MAG: DUF6036 family nucleotidyltransferase [Candidatus Nanoarchaeia archaeon]